MDTKGQTRSITFTVTDEDARRFITKCAAYGVTPAEALDGFVSDLICGANTGGSDERMYANQYFERRYSCGGYGMMFLQWAIGTSYILDFVDDLTERDHAFCELVDAETSDEASEIKSDYARFDQSMRETYGEYAASKRRCHEEPEPFEAAVESVRGYLRALNGIEEGQACEET